MNNPTSATLEVLGPFVATAGSPSALALPKKAQGLLAFLACNQSRIVRRDDLAALLWNDRPSAEARHSLRQCLAVVRKALGPWCHLLATDADTLAITAGEGLRIDFVEFGILEAGSSIVELQTAETLFRGEFLQGLSVRSEAFDSWLHVERQALGERRMSVLKRQCALQRDVGDLTSAIETARKLSGLDPYREDLHRLLLELLAIGGQRGLALVEHARIERRLRDDLGLAPDRRTRRLAEGIRSGTFEAGRFDGPGVIAPANAQRSADVAIAMAHPVVRLLPIETSAREPELHAFAKALPEELATALHRERWPIELVMAIRPGAERSGRADYELAGTVHCAMDRLRVSLQLGHVATGLVAWAHTFEASAASLFASPNDLQKLTGRLGAAVLALETRRVEASASAARSPRSLYVHAAALSRKNRSGNAHALRLLRHALELEPYAPAYALTARCLHVQRLMGWVHPRDPTLREAERFAYRAIELDPNDPEVLWMAGLALANVNGNASEGRALLNQSLNINPSNASAWIASAFMHAHSGEPEKGLADFARAQLVNPEDGSQHVQWHAAAMAHFIAGNYQEANQAVDRALIEAPTYPGSLRMKIATSALLGRLDDAQAHAKRLLRVNPNAGLGSMKDYWGPWTRHTPEALAALLAAWRRVGMPD